MSAFPRLCLQVTLGVLMTVAAATAEAAYLVVGDHPTGYAGPGATTMPFLRAHLAYDSTIGMCRTSGTIAGRYQQIYRSSEFQSVPGALLITQLAFRPAISGERINYSFDMTVPNVTITLSTTTVEPLFMTANFEANLGANATVVFQGDLHEKTTTYTNCNANPNPYAPCITPFDVVVTLQTPFRYDPQQGNLLLDVRYPSGSGSGTSTILSSAMNCGAAYAAWESPLFEVTPALYIIASAWSDTGSTGADLSGLVTRFTYDVEAPQTPLASFVYDLYSHALGRNPDVAGLTDWETYLGSHCNASGFTISADAFFDSLEFRMTRRETMAELVSDLYRALLNRESDATGLATWSANLKQARLDVAINGFIPSAEFQLTLPNHADRAAVTALVTRFYSEVLGRTPDDPGLQGWVNYVVASGDVNGTALAFLASAEFDAHRLTFRDYVTVLYRAFFGRTPDAAGLDAWEQVLRAHLVGVINQGFIPSPEFQAHVAQDCQ